MGYRFHRLHRSISSQFQLRTILILLKKTKKKNFNINSLFQNLTKFCYRVIESFINFDYYSEGYWSIIMLDANLEGDYCFPVNYENKSKLARFSYYSIDEDRLWFGFCLRFIGKLYDCSSC